MEGCLVGRILYQSQGLLGKNNNILQLHIKSLWNVMIGMQIFAQIIRSTKTIA